MDFPGEVTTNVFLVEDITKVYWSQWIQTKATTAPFTPNPCNDRLLASSIIYELRESRAHAYQEVGGQDVWLFDFSASSNDEFDEILVSRNYTVISQGCLEVKDLDLLDPTTFTVQGAMSSTQVDPSSKGTAPERSSLYKKAMVALSASLCHHFNLGTDEWMALGISTCLDLSTIGQSLAPRRTQDLVTNMINFESRLDVHGRLTILPTFSMVRRLCQVASFTGQDPQVGTPLLLSPSGISTKYRGRLSRTPSDFIQNSKSRCLRFLNHQGLSASSESEWILVEVNLDHVDRENFVTIWPANYVLLELENMESHSQDLGYEASEETDPLARAETWYLGRAARAVKADFIRKEIELQAQQQSSQLNILDRDVSSEVASPAFREIAAPQDISGIYPTPPDGLLSQTPASNVQQEASPKLATIGGTDDQLRYNDSANEDIFEDMDMDLVGEADFSFFDEPGIGDAASDQYAPEANIEVVGKDESLSNRSANSQIVEGSQTHLERENTDVDLDIAGKDIMVDSSHLEHNTDASGTSSPQEKHEMKRPYQQTWEEKLSDGMYRGSFNPLSLANLNFDGKYGKEGRFGYIPSEADRCKSESLDKREIFHIGAHLDRVDSLDGDSEDHWTDSKTKLALGYEINEDLNESSQTSGEDTSGSVATPESAMEIDSQAKMISPPSELYSPTADQDGMTNIFRNLKSPKTARTCGDQSSFIQVAQLVADQVRFDGSLSSVSSKATSKSLTHLNLIISDFFPSAKGLHLMDLVDSDTDQVHKLPSAALSIQRVGTMTDISLSAVPFWEELSLGPRSGPKDLNAFCIFPMKDYLVRPVKTFLEMMHGTYQVCNLGRHTMDDPQPPYPHGLVPIPNDGVAFDKDAAAKFVKHICGLRLTGGNTVVYMINIWDEGAIPEMCRLFLALFYAYRKAVDHEDLRNPNDLVLQIVPASMVFSNHKVVILSPVDYKRLAFQVYDRCGPTGSDEQSPYGCAPAICLAKPIPKTVDFKLTVNPQDAGDCLHLAYKWETGQQWLTACWTNNSGIIQWNAAYWLSEDEDIRISFLQAATAMLQTTRDMIQSQRAFYQICVVKDSPYEDFELEGWTQPPNSELHVTLLEIDPDPSLTLFPPQESNVLPALSDFLASPDTTPYTGTGALSPDVQAHASTPGGTAVTSVFENDPEARLIDITDETWMVTTENSIRDIIISSSHSLPLSTGYLIKRAGTQNEDGVLILRINLIRHLESRQERVKELLGMYRDLSLLARARKVVDPVVGILPIHVATARSAYATLCRTMHYE